MAFIAPLEVNGRSYPAAYIKSTIARSDSTNTVLRLQAWETQELRLQGVPPLAWPNDLRVLETDNDFPCSNPIDYGYQLLEASGEFPSASWNV